MAQLAKNGVLPCLIAGVVLGGGLGLSLSGWAQSQRVIAAEQAVAQALPSGASILGSESLDPATVEVLVDYRGQTIQVRMQRNEAGDWQQDVQATLMRGAEELQLLLAQDGPIPSIGQPAESLFETTASSTTLISPVDIDEATRRALDRAGRSNPFEPLDVLVPPPTTPSLGTGVVPPPVESLPDPIVTLPDLPDPEPAPLPPTLATPTPDPAAFARTVEVTGIIQIDGDSFALLDASGQEPAVVRSGDRYETAGVSQISAQTREVVLTEGGQFVTKPISASVLREAP